MNANSNGVILDSSILIDFNQNPRRLDKYIKGKTAYHIDDIEEELFKHYLELSKNKKSRKNYKSNITENLQNHLIAFFKTAGGQFA